jgi:hypothetical protein
VYTFKINASHIEMPLNWQTEKVLDTDEIAPPWFPGIKAALTKATLATATSTGTSSHPSDNLMKKLIDAQVLLATNLDPGTFSKAITTAASSAMNSSTRTTGTQVSAGIMKAIKDVLIPALQAGIPMMTMTKPPEISGATAIHTLGLPISPIPLLLGPNETIGDFISEPPKTSARYLVWEHGMKISSPLT